MSSDMFFPPSDCQAEWRPIPDAEFRPIQTIDGHLALFGADPSAIGQLDKKASCSRQKFSRGTAAGLMSALRQ
jgi:homoserine acetyltransferase